MKWWCALAATAIILDVAWCGDGTVILVTEAHFSLWQKLRSCPSNTVVQVTVVGSLPITILAAVLATCSSQQSVEPRIVSVGAGVCGEEAGKSIELTFEIERRPLPW